MQYWYFTKLLSVLFSSMKSPFSESLGGQTKNPRTRNSSNDNDDDNDVMIMMMITCQERPGRAHCRSPRIRIREARSSWRNKVCRKSPRQGNRNKWQSQEVSYIPDMRNISKIRRNLKVDSWISLASIYFMITMWFWHHLLSMEHFPLASWIRILG